MIKSNTEIDTFQKKVKGAGLEPIGNDNDMRKWHFHKTKK